jgi:hypothetical protein
LCALPNAVTKKESVANYFFPNFLFNTVVLNFCCAKLNVFKNDSK